MSLSEIFSAWNALIPLIQIVVIFVFFFFISSFLLDVIRRKLTKKAKTPQQFKAIQNLAKIFRYVILFLLTTLSISAASNNLKEFGLTVGIFSAAVGFSLQKPITGFAAWIMVVIRRPFEVGDRVTIGEVKGNVKEISLTHVYLEEVGRYGGEEVSGRTIILANYKLFEENIINYTFTNEYILGQIIFTITFESNLNKAIQIALAGVKKHTEEFNKRAHKEPHVRLSFTENGMEIHPRYFVPFSRAQEIATLITKDIYMSIHATEDIELSYHQQKYVSQRLQV